MCVLTELSPPECGGSQKAKTPSPFPAWLHSWGGFDQATRGTFLIVHNRFILPRSFPTTHSVECFVDLYWFLCSTNWSIPPVTRGGGLFIVTKPGNKPFWFDPKRFWPQPPKPRFSHPLVLTRLPVFNAPFSVDPLSIFLLKNGNPFRTISY